MIMQRYRHVEGDFAGILILKLLSLEVKIFKTLWLTSQGVLTLSFCKDFSMSISTEAESLQGSSIILFITLF